MYHPTLANMTVPIVALALTWSTHNPPSAGADDSDRPDLSMRVETTMGILVVTQAANPPVNPRPEPGYFGVWLDDASGRTYTYAMLHFTEVELGYFLLDLERRLEVDLSEFEESSTLLQGAIATARAEKRQPTRLIFAFRTDLAKSMGFAPSSIPDKDRLIGDTDGDGRVSRAMYPSPCDRSFLDLRDPAEALASAQVTLRWAARDLACDLGQDALLDHPVFAKYPSPEQLKRSVDKFKRLHRYEYAVAQADFGEAIRVLHDDPTPDPPWFKPNAASEWRLRLPDYGNSLWKKKTIEERENGITPWSDYVHEHIDEMSVEYSPALRIVLLDTLLNGWRDWSQWTSDRLRGYRERYPDVYQIAAVKLLKWMDCCAPRGSMAALTEDDVRETGLLLRIIMDSDASGHLTNQARGIICRIRGDLDALSFCVQLSQLGEIWMVRYNARYCIGFLSDSLSYEQQRDFWALHLDSRDQQIRVKAVSRVGKAIEALQTTLDDQELNEELLDRLWRMAESDLDPKVRLEADRRLTAYENGRTVDQPD